MALPQVGVQAVIEGMGAFDSNSKKVTGAFNDMDAGADKLAKNSNSLSAHITNLGGGLLKLGAIAGGAALAGVVALGAALTSFAVGGIGKAADLDQKLADIAATMGIAKSETGELKDLIFELSLNPDLTVNATQAASAIEVLAANGAELLDTQGKLTESGRELTTQVVAMSNATGGDFALSAAIATDAMNIFDLSAQEVGKAVDGATGVMIASKFNANDYALALANAGSVAAGVGIDIDDFNTVIAGTASQFSSGGDAGTSFKAFLQRLSSPTGEVKELMADLGISLFDSSGNMRDMSEVVGQLNSAFSGLTEAQRAEASATLGGADGARILLGLAGMTATEFEKLSGEVNKSGQGMTAAATRVDSFKGAMEIMNGVIEAIQIQVGDKFLPILRGMTVGFTDLASKVGPQVVDFFGTIADFITNRVTPAVEKVIQAFSKFGIRGAAVSILGQLGLDPAQVSQIMSIVDQVTGAIGKISEAFSKFGIRGASVSLLGQLGLDPGQIDLGSITGIMTTIGNLLLEGWNTFILPVLQDWRGQFFGWLREIYPQIPGMLTELTTNISTAIEENWPTIQKSLSEWATMFWDWVDEAIKQAGTVMMGLAVALGAWATSGEGQAAMTDMGKNIGGVIMDILGLSLSNKANSEEAMGNMAIALLGAVATIAGSLLIIAGTVVAGIVSGMLKRFGIELQPAKFSDLSGILQGIGKNLLIYIVEGFSQGIKKYQRVLEDNLTDMAKGAITAAGGIGRKITEGISSGTKGLAKTWNTIKTAASETWKFIQKTIETIMDSIKSTISKTWDNIKSTIDTTLNAIKSAIINAWNNIKSTVSSVLDSIKSTISKTWDNIKSAIDSTLNAIKSLVSSVWNSIKSTISSALDSIKSTVSTTWNNIKSTIDSTLNSIKSVISSVWSSIKSTIDTTLSSIKSTVSTTWNSIKSTIDTTLNSIKSSISTAWQNIITDIQTKVNTISATIQNKFNEIRNFITNFSTQLFNAAVSMIQGLINGINSKLTAIRDAMVNTVTAAINSLVALITGGGALATSLLDAGKSILNKIVDGIKAVTSLASELISKVSSSISSMVTAVTSGAIFSNLFNAGKSIISGLIKGIENAAGKVYDTLIGIIEDAIGQILDFLGASSPSKLMFGIGADVIMAGLQQGIASMAPAINASFQASINGIAAPVAAPVLGSAGAGSVTNNFYTGQNNINSQMDVAVFEARVLDVIRKNL